MKTFAFAAILVLFATAISGWHTTGNCVGGICPSGETCLYDRCYKPNSTDSVGGKTKFDKLIHFKFSLRTWKMQQR